MDRDALSTGEEHLDITRWECVLRIRGRDWRMRAVVADGFAWFSFGRAEGPVHYFMRQADMPTPDLVNHFRRAVMRAVEQL